MSTTQNQNPTSNQEEAKLYADTNISMKSGRLVRDAELTSEGKFVRIRLASNKQYEANGEVKSMTNYFSVLVSHNLKEAFETAKDLKKGEWAYIKGEDSSKSFDTPEGYKQTAVTTYAWKVTSKKAESSESSQPDQADPTPQPA